jgi:hypothetical protein
MNSLNIDKTTTTIIPITNKVPKPRRLLYGEPLERCCGLPHGEHRVPINSRSLRDIVYPRADVDDRPLIACLEARERSNGELGKRSDIQRNHGSGLCGTRARPVPEEMTSGQSEPVSTAPSVSITLRSSSLFSFNLEKSWLNAVWMTPSARLCGDPQAVRVVHVTEDLRPGADERLGAPRPIG